MFKQYLIATDLFASSKGMVTWQVYFFRLEEGQVELCI